MCVSGVRREGVIRIKRGKCTWDKNGEMCLGLEGGSVSGTETGEVYLG